MQRWLQACYRAHALLSGPLRGEELQFRNKVVRVVAHTIRLLVRVRMYGQARELDRAFFSRKESSRGGRKTGGTSAEGEVGGGGDQGRGRQQQRAARLAGKGLGLKRGNINIAWMQSLGLRLELRDNTGTEEFGDVLKQLREEQGGAQGINSHIISFLLRKGELLQIKLREDGMREGQARRQVQRMLEGIRGSERMGQVDVVRLALVETAMGEMEKEVKGRGRVDPQAFAQLEQDVRNLVGEMEALEGEEEQALHDVLNAEVRSAADKAALELRAQTLHLAIRFLLLQAHHSHHAIPELRHAIFRKSINSACKVYANLLDLLPLVVDSSPAEYLRLRERQTSALIRIVWACIGTVDFDAGEVQHDMIPVAQEEAAPPPDLPSVQQLLDVLDLTLTALPSSSSSTSAPLGISTRFWRRLLYILILPSAPSRRAGPLPAALRPPWPLLRRTFETILSARRHESTHPLLRSQPVAPRPLPVKEQRTTTTPSRAIPIASQALFLRTSFIFHLVRACLLGGSPSPSSSSSPEAEEQDPPARLAFLLEWISRMEGTTISRAEGRRGREVLRRGVVRSAVEEVAAKEWEGVVWKERRKVVRGLVVAWSEGEVSPSAWASLGQ